MSNTIIVFLSDHGEDFYDHYREIDLIPEHTEQIIPGDSSVSHGHSLYDELIRVPLIFYIPGLKPAKNIIENQVRLIDVMPTILDLLNKEYDALTQGASLKELILTGSREKEPPAISEATVYGPKRVSIRKDGYKYILIKNLKETQGDKT